MTRISSHDMIIDLMKHGALHDIDTGRLDGKCEDVIPLEDAIAIVNKVFCESSYEQIRELKHEIFAKHTANEIRRTFGYPPVYDLKADEEFANAYLLGVENTAKEFRAELERESHPDLCKSCRTEGCIFNSGIKREKCDFYS